MSKILATALAMGLVAFAAPAQATSTKIVFDDLDLSTAKGQARLEQRVDRAAREVCKYDVVRTGSRLRHPEVVACYKEAKAKAHAQVALLVERAAKGG